ncbi:hypothetical protein Scep_021527 [Stephania cephalantha]|uniref:Uncharacterized protein n=1 Tax=Stephania cephalantha TaxID=152367 RepID=A0AAP0HWX6_9MAGN
MPTPKYGLGPHHDLRLSSSSRAIHREEELRRSHASLFTVVVSSGIDRSSNAPPRRCPKPITRALLLSSPPRRSATVLCCRRCSFSPASLLLAGAAGAETPPSSSASSVARCYTVAHRHPPQSRHLLRPPRHREPPYALLVAAAQGTSVRAADSPARLLAWSFAPSLAAAPRRRTKWSGLVVSTRELSSRLALAGPDGLNPLSEHLPCVVAPVKYSSSIVVEHLEFSPPLVIVTDPSSTRGKELVIGDFL